MGEPNWGRKHWILGAFKLKSKVKTSKQNGGRTLSYVKLGDDKWARKSKVLKRRTS